MGCGSGELALALDVAGYDMVAVDPKAPDGPIFRRTTIEELDEPGPFDAVVASFSCTTSTSSTPSSISCAGCSRPRAC